MFNAVRRIQKIGWAFLVLCGTLLVAAANTGTSLLYIVTAGLFSFILLSLVLARWNLTRIELLRSAPHAVHRGDPLPVDIRIENRKWLLPSMSIRIENGTADSCLGYLLQVPPRRAALATLSYVFHRRGVQDLPPFDLVSTFPFGLLRHRRRTGNVQEVVVYPRVSHVRITAIEQASTGEIVACSPSAAGDEFFSLRNYVVGDDIRRIAWKASARTGKWVVREMSREDSRNVILAIDTRFASHVEEFAQHFEDSIDLAASLAFSLLSRQYNVAVLTPQVSVEGGFGTHQQQRILELLARLQPVDHDQFADFDHRVSKSLSTPAKIVYLTPDPVRWGMPFGTGRTHILDMREVLYV